MRMRRFFKSGARGAKYGCGGCLFLVLSGITALSFGGWAGWKWGMRHLIPPTAATLESSPLMPAAVLKNQHSESWTPPVDLATLPLAQRLVLLASGEDFSTPAGARKVLVWDALTPEEIREALKIVASWPMVLRQQIIHFQLLPRWARQDGAAALAWSRDNLPYLQRRGFLTQQLFAAWAATDPEAALAAYRQDYQEDTYSSSIATDIIGALAQRDWRKAWEEAGTLERRDQARQTLAQRAVKGPQRAELLDFLNALQAGDEEVQATLGVALNVWSAQSPAAAAEAEAWVEQHGLEPYARRIYEEDSLRGRMRENPVQTADNLLASAGEGERPERLRSIVDAWLPSLTPEAGDLNECAQWLNRLQPGPEADEAVALLAEKSAQADTEAAWAWAARISNPERRERTLTEIYRMAVMEIRQEEVERLLQASPLSAEEKASTSAAGKAMMQKILR